VDKAFEELDKDKNDKISAKELEAGLKAQKQEVSEEDI
jgi:Ca2+-binding EF-hand superfamily protein